MIRLIFLVISALIPPFILMTYVYRMDKVEPEPPRLVFKTVLYGAASTVPAVILEIIAGLIIGLLFYQDSLVGIIITNFLGVALIEEFCKMIACRSSVWNSYEFDYTFDGIVYCVAAAIGFAALENIEYVVMYGDFGTAIVRALTAIPGHTIFGILMGVHLGLAKYDTVRGYEHQVTSHIRRALLIPTLIHGTYDTMCSIDNWVVDILFYVLLIGLDIYSVKCLKKAELRDTEIY